MASFKKQYKETLQTEINKSIAIIEKTAEDNYNTIKNTDKKTIMTDAIIKSRILEINRKKVQQKILHEERLIKEKLNKERLIKERLIKERLIKEKLNKDKLSKEKLYKEKINKEKINKDNLFKMKRKEENKKKIDNIVKDIKQQKLLRQNKNFKNNIKNTIQEVQSSTFMTNKNTSFINLNKKTIIVAAQLNSNKETNIMISNYINYLIDRNNKIVLILHEITDKQFESNLINNKYNIIVSNDITATIEEHEKYADNIFIIHHNNLNELANKHYTYKLIIYDVKDENNDISLFNNDITGIIINNHNRKQYYIDQNINANKIEVLNLLTYKFKLPERCDNEIRLLYCGSLQMENHILEIIEEFQTLHKDNPNIVLNIIYDTINGDDTFKEIINNYIQNGVDGITFKYTIYYYDICYELVTNDVGICWSSDEEFCTIKKLYQRYNLPIMENHLIPYFNENKFLIMVPYCQVYEPFINECMDSILQQKYTNYSVLMINDGVKQYNKTYKNTTILYRQNEYGNGPGASKYHFVKHLQNNYNNYDKETIIAIVDGDDYLINKSVFMLINLYYNINNSLMTCGNYKGKWDNMIYKTESYLSYKPIRKSLEFIFPHIRTFKMKLIPYIKTDEFIYPNNKFIKKSTDKLLLIRLIEICGRENISLIYRKLYYYREHNNCSYKSVSALYKKKVNNYISNLPSSNKMYNFDFFKSPEQQIFINFLETNNITHCRISNTISHFSRILYLYNLFNYQDNILNHKNKKTLFFGLYTQKDIIQFNKHTGEKFILYAGTDCNPEFKINYNKVTQIIKEHPNTSYISISDCIYNRLTTIYNIDTLNITNLVIDLIDYNVFYCKQENNDNHSIFIYDGTTVSDSLIYNKQLCDEIEEELKHKYTIVRTSKRDFKDRILYENMYDFYKQFFIALRLTNLDGNANTVQEFKVIGKPIIHNQSEYGLKWTTKEDIIEHIETISNEIESKKNQHEL